MRPVSTVSGPFGRVVTKVQRRLLPGVDARPVALCSQAISSLSAGLTASDRAEPRAEHPGVNSDCVVDASVVARVIE